MGRALAGRCATSPWFPAVRATARDLRTRRAAAGTSERMPSLMVGSAERRDLRVRLGAHQSACARSKRSVGLWC